MKSLVEKFKRDVRAIKDKRDRNEFAAALRQLENLMEHESLRLLPHLLILRSVLIQQGHGSEKPTYQKTLCSRVPARSIPAATKETKPASLQEGGPRVSGKWIMLAILLTVWAGIAMWVLSEWREPQRVPLTYVSGQKAKPKTARAKSGPGRSDSDLTIRLELLTASRERTEKSFGSPKNIFAVFPEPISGPTPDQAPATDPAVVSFASEVPSAIPVTPTVFLPPAPTVFIPPAPVTHSGPSPPGEPATAL